MDTHEALDDLRDVLVGASALGVDHSTISGKLAGRRKWSMDDVDRLAVVFGLDWGAFFRVPTEVFRDLFERLVLETPGVANTSRYLALSDAA